MHLRSPSVAAGHSAFWWSLVFAVYLWSFLLAVGVSNAMAVICGALTFGASFLLIRTQGSRAHPRPRRRRRA